MSRIELEPHLSASSVGHRLQLARHGEGWNQRALAYYLHDMNERRLYLATGHSKTEHYAEAQLDMSPRSCREHIQVGRELQNLELLDEAFRDGEISWSRVVLLLRVIQRETQKAWVDFAKSSGWQELRDEVFGCRPGDLPGEGDDYGLRYQKQHFGSDLPDDLMRSIEEIRVRYSNRKGELPSDLEMIERFVQLEFSVGGAPPKPEPEPDSDHERNDEPIPDETREQILRRDGHRCCNCRTQFDVEVHHIDYRCRGGTNLSSNLLTLCKVCHASIHRGLLVLRGNPDSGPPTFFSYNGEPIQRIGGGAPPAVVITASQ